MLAPVYTVTDYLQQFLRLLPPGRIWRRGWGAVQSLHLLTLMPTWVRLGARAANLLIDAFPCSTTELLPEWEATLGLPNECTGELGTLQERTAAVCAAFAAQGGSSAQGLRDLAALMGTSIGIETFSPFRVSHNAVGDPLYDESWAYTAYIHVNANPTIVYFTVSQSAVGEPLVSYGNALFECALAALVPAHVTIVFRYGSEWDAGDTTWDGGASVWDRTGVVSLWDAGRSPWDGDVTIWDGEG
jgi:uncharacterized protein YmfQ (DUF2313 family)